MTTVWWQCRICASELYDSDHSMEHRLTTGHNDAALVTREVAAGRGSTPEGRRRARAIYEQARRDRADAIAVTEEESA
jgi:hypothetical protein